jgi:hypothetical protein
MAVRKANESEVSQNEDDVNSIDKEFTKHFVEAWARHAHQVLADQMGS